MLSVLKNTRRFYEDQLYNPEINCDLSMRELYSQTIPLHWRVYCSVVWSVYSGEARPTIVDSCVDQFLTSGMYYIPGWEHRHRNLHWDRRGCNHTRQPYAWHRIPVLVTVFHDSWDEPTWCANVRNRVFKVIRVHLCKNWLALMRVVVGKEDWCDDVVANTISEQLEAWFATVPHQEVQWSEYDDWLSRYRVMQW